MGPGTKLAQRCQRRDSGINKFNTACKEQDIAYFKYSDSINRTKADKELAKKAWIRVNSNDALLGEKAAAWGVSNIRKAKIKIGGSVKKKKKVLRYIKDKGLYLSPYKNRRGD